MVDLGSVFEVTAWDVVLLALLAVLVYRWWQRRGEEVQIPVQPKVAPLPMQDMTLSQLSQYDGVKDEHILFALNGTIYNQQNLEDKLNMVIWIYDVSRGRGFYGPGSAYGALAGKDATRPLATMDLKTGKEEFDDHADLTDAQKETADEWETSFKFKYPKVGKLLRDGEKGEDYEGKMSGIAV